MAVAIQQEVSLQPLNTLAIKAIAENYVDVNTPDELKDVLSADLELKLVLGGGSNILLTQDHIPGLVLHIGIKGIEVLREDDDEAIVRAMAGENWHEFVCWCIDHGYGGVENLSLIPGTVGAAPIQNIGAYGVELKDVLHEVEVINTHDGQLRIFSKNECRLGYRDSVFKHDEKGQWVILSVSFVLTRHHHVLKLEYGAIRDTLAKQGIDAPTIRDVGNAVMAIRRERLPDPEQLPNAGSFFKNPVITEAAFDELCKAYPNLPGYPAGDDQVKIPAGWLIEQCGWKGKRLGKCTVHDQHALVLVNDQGASGEEILGLARAIQDSVKERFALTLTFEVNALDFT